MLERPGRNKAYFNTGGMVKIRFIPPRPNSKLYAFFRPGQSMVNFFVSGGQSTPITLFYALDGHRISINQSEFRFCVEVGDHGAPFPSVKCLPIALCHTHFCHLAHVSSPTLSSSSSTSFSIYLALQH